MDIHRSAVMIALLSLSLSKSGMGPALKGNHRQDAADFNQKLQQGYDQIRAAHALMEQTMKQHAAFQANFDGGARSAADHWSDMIRGVDTVNDPSNGGATQLSNLGQYHFTVGFGNYRSR